MKGLVVTTARNGVFFGYAVPPPGPTEEIVLENARMCVFWDEATKGVLGLASSGPGPTSRITGRVPLLMINEITAIMVASDGAVAAWESAPWLP